jgi:hypothetical protein
MEVLFLIFIVAMVWAANLNRRSPGWVEELYSAVIGAAMAHRGHQQALEAAREQHALELCKWHP